MSNLLPLQRILFLLICLLPVMLMAAEPSSGQLRQSLDIEQRIACQATIEDIRWSHRIWPAENPAPKPAREEVLSDVQIRAQVEESLRMEAALKEIYDIDIDERMLQAEMNRMARTTRAPQRLRELFQALGNDPVKVADCLARPALVKRLLRNHYNWDERQHGVVRKMAMAALSGDISLEESKGTEHKLFLVRDEGQAAELVEENVTLQDDEAFEAKRRELMGRRSGKPVALRETEVEFVQELLLASSDNRLDVLVRTWPKRRFGDWWRVRSATIAIPFRSARYAQLHLPALGDKSNGVKTSRVVGGDTWALHDQLVLGVQGLQAVWTGTEMIVWGGSYDWNECLNSGGRYDPVLDTWTPVTLTGAPLARNYHSVVWTGLEMLVWGGEENCSGRYSNTGGRYNPATDSWQQMSTVGAPVERSRHTVVWTGHEMIVWGGYNGSSVNTGGRYDPSADQWFPVSLVGAPSARREHTAVWTGKEMIIWGGREYTRTNTGGRYDPVTDSWTATNLLGATARTGHTAVWTGNEMIVWGGSDGDLSNVGARYDPVTDSWVLIDSVAPEARAGHTAVWTGNEMIIWGERDITAMYWRVEVAMIPCLTVGTPRIPSA
ncbi:Kelch repeat-containing protein [Thiolapillus brandeum]|uniref:Galactose oxidase n=1 Tax=Thiolapillus brandeum TaxID=1076588 RepID=A0A7U6GL48_9GAMM|nr:hypothetical protein [Thiolapillus brandeum]BAO45597.1 hypothetical protein TBH_C2692 [Thiolapillus brandeum]